MAFASLSDVTNPDRPSADETLLVALRRALGDEAVLTGADVTVRARHVWDARPIDALAVIRPSSTEQVADTLRLCNAAGRSVVTHGGLTGLVGGNDSLAKDVVLSLERLRRIESLDAAERTITVQAGTVLENVQRAAEEAGLQFGLDLGARGSCTIGGNIATNAGGLSVLRYGMMREQVLGLEAVLADGTIVSSMKGLLKNNTGYDWTQLLIGSEGTLGVVTRAVLRLHPATPVVATAMLGCERLEQVGELLGTLSRELDGTLNAFEVIWNPFYRLNTDPERAGHVDAPLGREHPLYAIVESRGSDEGTTTRFDTAMEKAFEKGLITDAVLARSEHDRQRLWAVREQIEIALTHDPVFVYDVSLAIGRMQDYLDDVDRALREHWPQVRFFAYGHLADGNLHLMVAPEAIRPGAVVRHGLGEASEATLAAEAVSDRIVYDALRAVDGSVSAEHGIGTKKKRWLAHSRSAAERRLMHTLKHALDPEGTLNPGKVL